MEITKDTTIGDIVAEDYKKASVFEKYGIDFCCNGNRSLSDACDTHQIHVDELIENLKNPKEDYPNSAGGKDFNSWPLDLLADYIEKTHHRYADAKILEIKPYLAKITQVHGGSHPELKEVEAIFEEAAGEFVKHMKKEEIMFFPKIRKMIQSKDKGEPIKLDSLKKIQQQIEQFLAEHDQEGDAFRKISELTNNYTTPEDGCNTYKVSLEMVKEFEADLHLHIHLENNILFPKSIEVAKELAKEVA